MIISKARLGMGVGRSVERDYGGEIGQVVRGGRMLQGVQQLAIAIVVGVGQC